MTSGFPIDYWYVAALSGAVGRALLARTIMSRPVLLYRTENGDAIALEDRCIHRRVSLSVGVLSVTACAAVTTGSSTTRRVHACGSRDRT